MNAGKTVKKVKGDVRRGQVVQASLKIIGEKGVASLTTSAIALEVGISEANVYRHFRNKEDIYFAAVTEVGEMITKNLEKAFAGGSDPIDIFKRFFGFQISLMERNRGIPRFMFSEELHVHAAMREKILKTMYTVSKKLAGLVKQGQKTGLLRKDIDPLTTVLMFIAMIQGLAFRWSLSGLSFSLSREGMKAWKNFEKCITIR